MYIQNKPRWTHLDRDSYLKLPLSTKRSVAAHSLLNHIECDISASPSTFPTHGCLLLPFCHHFSNEGSEHWSTPKDTFLLFPSPAQLRTPLILIQPQGREQGEGDVGKTEGGIASLTDLTSSASYKILVFKYRCRGLTLGTHLGNFSSLFNCMMMKDLWHLLIMLLIRGREKYHRLKLLQMEKGRFCSPEVCEYLIVSGSWWFAELPFLSLKDNTLITKLKWLNCNNFKMNCWKVLLQST